MFVDTKSIIKIWLKLSGDIEQRREKPNQIFMNVVKITKIPVHLMSIGEELYKCIPSSYHSIQIPIPYLDNKVP